MKTSLLIAVILILSLTCVFAMFYRLKKEKSAPLSWIDWLKLTVSGVVAFIADALGIGSFAVNIALARLFGTFSDEELPAVNNGAQVIPGTIESLYFMTNVNVDATTLLTLVMGACFGGLIGGSLLSRLHKQSIRLAMMICFAFILILLLLHQFHLMPQGGDVVALTHWKLVMGFAGMVLCGALTSVGIGLFVLVQALLFLLNVSPAVAFPIMTTAGAMQQPLTTLVFLQQGRIPLKKTLILSFAGCFGVYLAVLLFNHLNVSWLHSLLLCIVIYNLITMTRAWLSARNMNQQARLHRLQKVAMNG